MRTTTMALGLVLFACGGKAPAAEPTTAAQAATDVSGGEAQSEQAAEPAAEQAAEPEPAAQGPAKLTVITKVGRDAAAAKIRVLSEDGSVLAEGKPGQPLAVQSGELTIEATITDEDALADRPTLQKPVTVEAGGELTETVTFERSLVKVMVNIKGKLDPTAIVTLSKDGKTIAKLVSGAAKYVPVSPGRYAANVKSKRAEITVNEIILNEGATHNLPINAD